MEIDIARLCFVDGLTPTEAAERIGTHRRKVQRVASMISDGMKQIGVNPDNGEMVRDVIGAILRRIK